MNEAMKNLMTRRSVRKYKADMVPMELIEQVMEAGLYAASASGRQDAIVVAVTDKETRDKLSAANAAIQGAKAGADPFYGAPVVLIVLAEKDWPNRIYDGSCMMENLMLAAHALGLGSCWIHRARQEFELPKWQEWLKSIGVEGEYEGIGHCILGYPDGDEPAPADRKENRKFIVA
ncbi:MAG: nitroreductase [Eubacteriaceae bacterium]|nr:nitroreductase [Eubacteriaceae bacterium]